MCQYVSWVKRMVPIRHDQPIGSNWCLCFFPTCFIPNDWTPWSRDGYLSSPLRQGKELRKANLSFLGGGGVAWVRWPLARGIRSRSTLEGSRRKKHPPSGMATDHASGSNNQFHDNLNMAPSLASWHKISICFPQLPIPTNRNRPTLVPCAPVAVQIRGFPKKICYN